MTVLLAIEKQGEKKKKWKRNITKMKNKTPGIGSVQLCIPLTDRVGQRGLFIAKWVYYILPLSQMAPEPSEASKQSINQSTLCILSASFYITFDLNDRCSLASHARTGVTVRCDPSRHTVVIF